MRLGWVSVGLLCALPSGCGQTHRDGLESPPDPADPCVRRPPIAQAAQNCAYQIAAAVDLPAVENVASLGQANCRYRLGEPRPLPFATGTYAFSFDVNGDLVGDVFAWDDASGGALQLAVSRVEGGLLSYDRVECEALKSIPEGRAFVRDLNGDSVPDILVGVSSELTAFEPITPNVALRAFVNLPSGFVEVLHHEWPEATGKTTIVDLAVGDYNADAHCLSDVAFGYDRVFGPTSDIVGIEIGVLQILSGGQWPNLDPRENKWMDEIRSGLWTTGELASGTEPSAPPLLVVHSLSGASEVSVVPETVVEFDGGSFVEREVSVELPENPLAFRRFEGPFDAWFMPFADRPALALLHERDLLVHDFGANDTSPLPVLLRHAVLGEHSRGRELGGGPQVAPRFMIDVEGDGDLDFVEQVVPRGLDPANVPTMAIHANEQGAAFAAGIEFAVRDWAIRAEHPFAAVGAAQGALIVNDTSVYDSEPPSVQALECAPDL